MTAIADLIHADADQSLQPALVQVIGDDAGDDRADRVPANSEQARDRREGHLLRQPRHDVFEVARVRRAWPGPRDGLQPHTARAAAQPPQLTLDPAATRSQIQMAPALDAPVVGGICNCRPVWPHSAHTRRRRRNRTVTSTPSLMNETSTTLAPDRRSRRLNAVVIRTPPSSVSR